MTELLFDRENGINSITSLVHMAQHTSTRPEMTDIWWIWFFNYADCLWLKTDEESHFVRACELQRDDTELHRLNYSSISYFDLISCKNLRGRTLTIMIS
jgi:hypothetical protein